MKAILHILFICFIIISNGQFNHAFCQKQKGIPDSTQQLLLNSRNFRKTLNNSDAGTKISIEALTAIVWRIDAILCYFNNKDPKYFFSDRILDSLSKIEFGIINADQNVYEKLRKILLIKDDTTNLFYPKSIVAASFLHQMEVLNLNNHEESIEELIKKKNYGLLVELYQELERYIAYKHTNNDFDRNLQQKLGDINTQLQYISEIEFSEYRFTKTSRQILKGINIYHDNDMISGFPGANEDMNYTGGFKIELTTDLLKLRLADNFVGTTKWRNGLSKVWIIKFFAKEIYRLKVDNISYQSLYYGLEVYTPYLRFNPEGKPLKMNGDPICITYVNDPIKNQKLIRDSSYKYDRPFASIAYLGRTKYRINEMGTVRTKGEFSIGIIGGSFGKTFQSALHRDITIASPKPIGWDKQIASGGRLSINMSEQVDILLLSKKNDVFHNIEDWKKQKNYEERKNWSKNANIYCMLEVRYGQELTYPGLGIGISNLNFKDKSGSQIVKPKLGKTYSFGWSFEAKYRRIIHNSLLEGVGWFKTKESNKNGSPGERISPYVVDRDFVNRNLLIGDLFVGLRTVKTMLFINISANNREFYPEKIANGKYRKDQLFNTQAWYPNGRIGFNFLL